MVLDSLAAISVARWQGAHLTAVAIAEQPAYYYGIGSEVSADIYLQDVERAQEGAKALAAAANEKLAASGVLGDVRWATGTAAAIGDVVARHARYAERDAERPARCERLAEECRAEDHAPHGHGVAEDRRTA